MEAVSLEYQHCRALLFHVRCWCRLVSGSDSTLGQRASGQCATACGSFHHSLYLISPPQNSSAGTSQDAGMKAFLRDIPSMRALRNGTEFRNDGISIDCTLTPDWSRIWTFGHTAPSFLCPEAWNDPVADYVWWLAQKFLLIAHVLISFEVGGQFQCVTSFSPSCS